MFRATFLYIYFFNIFVRIKNYIFCIYGKIFIISFTFYIALSKSPDVNKGDILCIFRATFLYIYLFNIFVRIKNYIFCIYGKIFIISFTFYIALSKSPDVNKGDILCIFRATFLYIYLFNILRIKNYIFCIYGKIFIISFTFYIAFSKSPDP